MVATRCDHHSQRQHAEQGNGDQHLRNVGGDDAQTHGKVHGPDLFIEKHPPCSHLPGIAVQPIHTAAGKGLHE